MEKLKKYVINSKIQKIRELDEKIFSFEIYGPKKRKFLTIILDKGLFLSDVKYESGIVTDFCRVLRKHLTGQRIENVQQHEFDRIVEIDTEDYKLILELFGSGNLILVERTCGKIISAFEARSWKGREIRPGRKYLYPPSPPNPFELKLEEFKTFFGKKETVKVLASDLGFGGEIAEQICEKIGIDKTSKEIGNALELYEFIQHIEEHFRELDNINEKLRKEFEEDILVTLKTKKMRELEQKFEKIRKKQAQRLKELIREEEKYRNLGESIYNNYSELKRVLEKISSMKSNELSWEEIAKTLEIEALPEKHMVVINGIPLDLRKTLGENASIYFQEAKRIKKKIEGLKKAMKELEKEEIVEVEKKKEIVEKKPKEWYDKFRWFRSSDGFLVVAGKDAICSY